MAAQPVTAQPGGGQQWMAAPGAIPGCPPGLEYLTQIDQLLVHQQVELFEAFTGIEMNNKYKIKNSLGQQVYFAYEETDICMRIMCGNQRSFTIHVTDNNQQEVMRVRRDFKCCAGCCWCAGCCDCCAFEVYVEAPVGQQIGIVRQMGSGWKAHYSVMNGQRDEIFKIWGPCCAWSGPCCMCDVDFDILGTDGTTKVGAVTRQYAGFVQECFTKASNFSMTFPQDLDVKMKATLFGAAMLIQQPVTAQPGVVQQWMPTPAAIPGCPPGLEYLTQIDQLLVHQQVELFEAFTGVEMNNKYKIKNSLGQQVYFAYEETDFCMRIMCGNQREFTIHVTDNNQQEVMRIHRDFKCCAGCCWCAGCCDCCAFEVTVEAPVGQQIGIVRQLGSKWKPHFSVMNGQRDEIFKIWGPCCVWAGPCCTCDVDFNIFGTDGVTNVGAVTRQYAGFVQECFTKASNFSMTFPQDLDVKVKATLFGAAMLIAVTNQPMQWMAVPGAIPGCPPGLEYLTQLDQLLVQQQVELLEAFTGIETKNKYAVKNSMGQQVYFAYEESDFCSRICCGAHRGFQFHVTDNNGQAYGSDGHTEVGKVTRQFAGFAKEMFTDATNFSVTFPQDLDVKLKATMLGACLLVESQAANVAMMYDLAQSHWARFVVLGDALASRGHNVTVVAPEDILSWIHRGVRDPFNYLTFPEAGTRTYVEDYIGKAWTRILEQRAPQDAPVMNHGGLNGLHEAVYHGVPMVILPLTVEHQAYVDVMVSKGTAVTLDIRAITPEDVISAIQEVIGNSSVPMPASWLGSGVPAPTCCFPVPFSGLGRVRTFRDRVQNLAGYVATMVFGRAITAFYFDHLAKKYIGADATFVTALADTDLWLLTEHPGLDPVRPHMPNMVNIGGFMATPAKPLPQDLEDFMQGSDHGVIIFGLGTFVKGVPAELAEVFASAFAQLPQRVVWRYDEKEPPRGLGKNTKVMKWMPQNDLLGHPKTRLFMNHGGLNGLHEAVYHGVPMVILPLTVEHQAYADVMVSKGTAVTLDIRALTPEDVVSAIQEVIGNSSYLCLGESRTCSSNQRRPPYSSVPDVITSPAREFDMDFELNSYKESAERLAKLFHDQPQPPLERAVWWIEHVIRHGGLPHLRTAMNDVPFYQYFHLDVLVVFVAIVTALWLPFTRIFIMKYCWQRMATPSGSIYQ
uniref:UDP-glycosyltransferases domain-containing protein n=1 Tax=Branchiostoma floridae TaxID=7739 RepID=C3ZI41_BRAFL|eukprot:XP_002591772.1 hypothetical protein BRAFLDRAFT_123522 [Branchiostoma floridae]